MNAGPKPESMSKTRSLQTANRTKLNEVRDLADLLQTASANTTGTLHLPNHLVVGAAVDFIQSMLKLTTTLAKII